MQYTVEDISNPSRDEKVEAYPFTLMMYFVESVANEVEIIAFLDSAHAWMREQFGPPKTEFKITRNVWGMHEDNRADPHNHPVWWADKNAFRFRYRRDATAFRLRFG